jgi:hypothetical protein
MPATDEELLELFRETDRLNKERAREMECQFQEIARRFQETDRKHIKAWVPRDANTGASAIAHASIRYLTPSLVPSP